LDLRATAWREGRVNGGRVHGRALIATLAGVETRDDALALRGAEIGVLRAALPRAKKNEIYWADLVGLEVRNRESKVLGAVVDVVTHGAHPILRVARPAGSVGGERLIPFVPAIVDRVDLDAARIDVDWGEDY
jgi:16S rRNA processing protein RimM